MSELKQTDLSKRLRHFAQQQPTVIISADFAIQCAEEIERYFNGMRNWKASAEAMHRTQPEDTKPAPWSQIVESQTVTLNYSFASAVLGALFNGASNNPEAFEQIKQAFAAIMRGEKSPMPTCLSAKPAQDLGAAILARPPGGAVSELAAFQYWAACQDEPISPISAWNARAAFASPADALVAGDRVDAELREALEELYYALPDILPAAGYKRLQETGQWSSKVAWDLRGHTGEVKYRADDMQSVYAAMDRVRAAIQAQKDGHG